MVNNDGFGSPGETYQLPSLPTLCLVATEYTSSSRQISETHVKPFKVTLKFSFIKAQWI